MARKKKGSSRRAALKSFAAKGRFQSPVHSNGFKQDMLIDLHGGDIGFQSGYGHPSKNVRAEEAVAAGKSFFEHGGVTYKAGTAVDPRSGGTVYTATLNERRGKVR